MQKLEKKKSVKNIILKPNFNKKKLNKKAKVLQNKYGKSVLFVVKRLKLKWYRAPFHRFFTKKLLRPFSKRLHIKVTSNNIFCNLKTRKKNKTLVFASSGKYKIKTTRKRLRYSIKLVLGAFMNELLLKFTVKRLIIKLIAPKRIKKQIIRFLATFLKDRTKKLIIKILTKKCFNGCRPAKKKRKKQKGLRIFK